MRGNLHKLQPAPLTKSKLETHLLTVGHGVMQLVEQLLLHDRTLLHAESGSTEARTVAPNLLIHSRRVDCYCSSAVADKPAANPVFEHSVLI